MSQTRAGITLTIALLLGFESLRTFALPRSSHLVANLAAAAGLYGVARWAGASDPELGLTRWRHGLRLGLLAVAVVGAGIILGAVLPVTRDLFDRAPGPDGRPHRSTRSSSRSRSVRSRWRSSRSVGACSPSCVDRRRA